MRVAKAAGVDVAKYEAAISGDAEAPVLPSSITQPACRSDPESMSKLTEFAFDVTLADRLCCTDRLVNALSPPHAFV